MLRRLFRSALKMALVAGVGAAVSKVLARRRSEPFPPVSTEPWPPIDTTPPAPAAPATGASETATGTATGGAGAATPDTETTGTAVPGVEVPAPETAPGAPSSTTEAADEPEASTEVPWVEPDDEGECPVSHPVKAKLGSGVFHLPGMANYERTKADRCYPDADAAEADDLRQAQR